MIMNGLSKLVIMAVNISLGSWWFNHCLWIIAFGFLLLVPILLYKAPMFSILPWVMLMLFFFKFMPVILLSSWIDDSGVEILIGQNAQNVISAIPINLELTRVVWGKWIFCSYLLFFNSFVIASGTKQIQWFWTYNIKPKPMLYAQPPLVFESPKFYSIWLVAFLR